ncbi:MAG: PilC/PilY family type IV pilus protein [Nevskia sp.]|nr:PilC/PilY family type IV pilus protein [Nevskia sp.]
MSHNKNQSAEMMTGAYRTLILLAVCAGLPSYAATLSFPSAPLFVANSASPNIMLMVDNSGSMQNIVPEAPYDTTNATLYPVDPTAPTPATSCTAPYLIATSASIDININSGGPRIRVNGGTTYQLGASRATETYRCFDPTATYNNVRLNADSGSGPSGYLGTSYSGNFLNWYFNPLAISGSYTQTWTGSQQRKPLTGSACPSTAGTTCANSRIQIARTSAANLINTLDNRLRVGFSTYNNGNGGTLITAVTPLGTVGSAARNSLITGINNLSAAGNTPLAETLADIGRYFATGYTGNLTLHPLSSPTTASVNSVFNNHSLNGSGGATAPITLSCQRSFAVLLTDGRPQADRAISTSLRDYIGDCAAGRCNATSNTTPNSPTGVILTSNAGLANGVQVGRSYESDGSDYLDDVAQALNDIDLRPDFPLESTDNTQFKNNLVSYFVGFADPAVQNDPLLQSAASHGGSGTIQVANNSGALADVFGNIISNILVTSGSFSSVATNSTRLNTGASVYQALFNSGDWSGQLESFAISLGLGLSPCSTIARGNLCPTATWNASTQLTAQTPNTRTILTYNPDTSSTNAGLAFRWSSLPTSYQAALDASPDSPSYASDGFGQQRLNWLRGDRNSEAGSSTPALRARSSVLGDIVSSNPYFVGAPPFAYALSGYSSFRTANQARTPVVYVGANDGMLHGFNANTGDEVLAYVPSKAYARDPSATISTTNQPLLAQVTQRTYTHRFVADGSPTIGDACLGATIGPSCWKSILVSGMRSGGQGVFALDVTNPSSFAESNASTVLWEFTDADDADLGFTFSQPAIVRMPNGRWAAIIGNGYNNKDADGHVSGTGPNSSASSDGRAALFILFLEGPQGPNRTWRLGTDYIKLVTSQNGGGAASGPTSIPNGLATPAPVDTNGDGLVDYVYAGDERGNMWRFDTHDANANNWVVGNSNNPIFTAFAPDGVTRQPITDRPDVGFNRATSDPTDLIVYFGTGRYIDTNDNSNTSQITQSFYGIFDNLGTFTPNASRTGWNLLQQTILTEVNSSGSACTGTQTCFRVTSNFNYGGTGTPTPPTLANAKGWFIDFVDPASSPQPPTAATANRGERQVTGPILRNGRIIFTTLTPSPDPCGFGGSGYLMELDAITGSRLNSPPPFDTNNDGAVNDIDKITVTINGVPTTISVSGQSSSVGILAQPDIVNTSDTIENAYVGGSNGSIAVVRQSTSGRAGRITWREIIK